MSVSLTKPLVLSARHWEACNLECPALHGHPCPRDRFERCPSYSPKFSSAAAELLWTQSLDSSQDKECGETQYGNGWHALFRIDRAILHTDSQGFVSAWLYPTVQELEDAWKGAQADAAYESDGWETGDYSA